jgi:hypothetical protein
VELSSSWFHAPVAFLFGKRTSGSTPPGLYPANPNSKATKEAVKMVQKIRMQTELYNEAWFETLFQTVDRLHDAASVGNLESPVPQDVMVGWLEDIIYTAKETILELQANNNRDGGYRTPGGYKTPGGR